MATKQNSNYTLSGSITDRQGKPLAGLIVRAYDQDPKTPDNPLGKEAITEAAGRYTIRFTEKDFKIGGVESGGPDVFIRVFDGESSLGESPVTRSAKNPVTIDLQIDYVIEDPNEPARQVSGVVRDAQGGLLQGIDVRAFDRDLRSEQALGQSKTDKQGFYHIQYFKRQFRKAEKGSADLVVKAFATDGSLLAASPVLFNAPLVAEMDVAVPAEVLQPSTLFEKVGRALPPLIEGLKVEDLEEDKDHQDLSFLAGETGFGKPTLARFVIAHKLAQQGIRPEFWFVLLGGSFYEYTDTQSLTEQVASVLNALPSLDAAVVRKALTRGFNTKEIPETFQENAAEWIEAFLKLVARRLVAKSDSPTFVKLALEHAGIAGTKKQETFARLFNEQRTLTPELIQALGKDKSFKKEEIADLHTSFQLAELTQGDFSVVQMIKERFGVRQPEQIRRLAKRDEREWVNLVTETYSAGDIKLPFEVNEVAAQIKLPEAQVYGKMLARQFRETFPTTAFAGGLERALQNGGVRGLRYAEVLSRFLDLHETFELLNTPVDDFLKGHLHPDVQALARDESFRLEVKAVQRVFKLIPTFEATDILLSDDLHSAQKIYRLGESEFVRRYADRPGFNAETARRAWNRAADTYAAVLTVVADLKALETDALPLALQNNNAALATFPNWNNLFKTGDLCECEDCRSVLSPAAYFADLLMFLKDRNAANPAQKVKDILFRRRSDLGFLELNCDNALTTLPYIDVVCEVLEDVVAAGENDLELPGFSAMPADHVARKAAVAAAFTAQNVNLGADFSLSQVNPLDPDRWVARGDDVTYLLKKKATPNFFAEILRNTKASAEELRTYPQYVNPKAYDKLRAAKYPLILPFDLFAEEVRAGFQKTHLQRWDVMRVLRGTAAPNNPSDGEIAAEYFGISSNPDPAATFDEKRLILMAEESVGGQQAVWGETGANWLSMVGNVKNFLQKTGLEYNELLALCDLKFINPAGDISIQHLDASCDTGQKVIQALDTEKLDRIHRFLRLWRKLDGWKMWELDRVLRCPGIGHKDAAGDWVMDEAFLINLFYFAQLRDRLAGKTTVEQVCALFGNLNTETHFTKLHEKREDALYQNLFLNRRLIKPLDPAFRLDPGTGDLHAGETITGHQSVVLAVLGIREADLVILEGLTKASDGKRYITDKLTLSNLSFLWRHAWLARLLKFKAEDWKLVLKMFQQDILDFANPAAAWKFVEFIDSLNSAGFTPDEMNWLLAADCTAKAAVKESDAARFLIALRKDLQAIQTEYDQAQYSFLTAMPPSDVASLTMLLTSLLQKLNRDEGATQFFIATLRDEVSLQKTFAGLPAGFDFPVAIKNAIRIRYDAPATTLRFTGLMTTAERMTLLTDASLAAVTGIAAYQEAIEEFFTGPRLTLKFFELVFTAPLANLPEEVDFKSLPDPALALKISYDAEQQLLRFAGILSKAEKAALDALSADAAYRNAVNSLATQPGFVVAPDERIWLLDADLQFPLRDLNAAANDHLAKNLVTAATKALTYLSKTLSEGTVVQEASSQLGLTEALTRRLLAHYALLPNTLLTYLTGTFSATLGVVDYTTLKTTFDGWFWVSRVAAILKKWKITLADLVKLTVLTGGAQLLDFSTLPLDNTGAIASIERFLRTGRLLRLRDCLPETKTTFLEVLEKLNSGVYAAPAAVNVQGLPVGFTFPLAIIAGPNPIPIQYDEPNKMLRFTGQMSTSQREKLLTDASLAAVIGIASYRQAIEELFRSNFAGDMERLNEAWLATDVVALTASLDLAYPADYLLAESWERLRRVFYFLDNLNAGADTVKSFAAAAMSKTHASTLKELLRSKFGTETWLTLSAEIQDILRERKRDALAAYLLTPPHRPADAPSGKWENTNDLYAYYLLDVEMSSCQLTSRLVQGQGSVQLFVQRCFMGLEPEVVVKADGDDGGSAWRWWKWMRKFQVWVANKKVFLWPENWIEPELKKDRSPFFKDLENELLQNEVNQYTVETAFLNYLEKLENVAQLEIAGFYQEDDGDNTIIHVFGRTTGVEPHLYYYRRYDYRQWSPWEKVDLDIQGDYLIPAVVNKRLFLFWPVFTEVPDEEGNSIVTIPAASPEEQPNKGMQKTKKKLRLQMAVSDYRLGKWTPKRVSKDVDESTTYDVEIVRKCYHFFPFDRSELDGQFVINYYTGSSVSGEDEPLASLDGAFEISGCKGLPELTNGGGSFIPLIRPEQDSTGYDTTFMKWVELNNRTDKENDFTLENYFPQLSNQQWLTTVLVQTPWIFKVSPPWHLSYMDKLLIDGLLVRGNSLSSGSFAAFERRPGVGSWLPFFYNDKQRTFFILPSLGGGIEVEECRVIYPGGPVRRYYPEIKTAFRWWENYFEGQVQTWLDSIDLSTLTPDQRQQVEQSLLQAFPEETLPPYTDEQGSPYFEQVKKLLKRWFMRYIHYFLGVQSLNLFELRQFHFKNYYHPFVCDFAKLVYNPLKGIPALMSRETQLKDTGFSFQQSYQPTPWVVKQPADPKEVDAYPKEMVDFSPDGAYAPYNWELFFHAPLLIANSLSKNQRFEEARDWYHFIFNPIGVESPMPGGPLMSKYWITKPFFETTDAQYIQQRIDNILRMLAGDTSDPAYLEEKAKLESAVLDWRTNPFEPHRIANYRTVAYQKTVVMKYLDNLIAWGDNLFQQDSMESINEATQLYILAAEILGPRPKKIPPQAKPPLESFNELETEFDKFSNALVEVENLVPVLPGTGSDGTEAAPLPMLYFCITQNEKMLGYWDTVADRLYKIRHCMNIEGVVRQLALFEPPIEPGALVKAIAGGVDISSALANLNAPLPLYRFNVLLQKANEMCSDVKALGSALLVALEKKDAEALGLLRQNQEIRLLEAVKAVREKQIEEAKENLEGLKKSKVTVETRRNYYRDIERLITQEKLHLDKLSEAHTQLEIAQGIKLGASIVSYLPAIDLGSSGFGGSPLIKFKIGGLELGQAASLASDVLSFLSQIASDDALMASSKASFDRRWDDWKLQERLAEKELDQLDRQIASAELRVTIAEKELENQSLQIDNAKATDAFMRSKYTNEELYQWQVGQISGVYFQSYKLAYDLAKRAERCFRFELGLQGSSYINFGYWDSLKKGLLSGEKLQYDLRRLETAYLEQNRREFELTKHISLALLDPLALVKLRETGCCLINLPEEIFDLDYPGHYFRRIKSASLTLPCVVGPYTAISCTLRLLKNSIRINPKTANGYPRNTDDQGLPADDDRFIENNIPVKAIAASNAQNDSGVFELSFRDERYLPFEGAGAISQWSLELFSDLPSNNPDPTQPDFGKHLRQFDYGTISDAILHIKYTAREDAGAFKNAAIAHLRAYFSQDGATPSLRMFNLRQEFPSQWHRFLHPTDPAKGNIFELEMSPSLFLFRDEGKTLKVNTIWLLARCTNTESYNVVMTPPLPVPPPTGSNTMTLARVNQYGGLYFCQKDVAAFGIVVVPTDKPITWQLKMTRPGGGNLQEDPTKKEMEVEDVLIVLGYEWE